MPSMEQWGSIPRCSGDARGSCSVHLACGIAREHLESITEPKLFCMSGYSKQISVYSLTVIASQAVVEREM